MKKGDMLLVGVDLKKDPRVIDKAYNCDIELNEAFVLNSLARINRELEGTFDLKSFFAYCHYNPMAGEI